MFKSPSIWVFVTVILLETVFGYQFRFDLPESDEECFGQELEVGATVGVAYRVISGGNLDIDVIIQSPSNKTLYDETRVQSDNFEFAATEKGAHVICFSNEFSTITHKNIYVSLRLGEEFKPIALEGEEGLALGPLTFMETASTEIYSALEDIMDFQTRFRMQEAQGRVFAEEIHERVLWWSIMQSFMILVIGITQVMILRNFFDTPASKYPIRPRNPRYMPMVR